jgi:membrane protein involved in colicin uptake
VRDTVIKQAGFAAETEQAKARAAQAGPLAQAEASQQVIEQQTALAEREAELTGKRLESEVRRPADAEAYRTRTIADANRDKVKAETDAEAFRQRALAEASRDTIGFSTEAEANKRRKLAEAEGDALKVHAAADMQAKRHEADGDAYAARTVATAEAEAINVRASALGDGNQQLIAANKLIDVLPSLVQAAAAGIANSNLTVLNGSEGVGQMVAGVVGQGLTIYETLRKSIVAQSPHSGNGSTTAGSPSPPDSLPSAPDDTGDEHADGAGA